MRALFIGHAYIDVTMLTDVIPTGDEKAVARDYAVSFGGNAVTAAFCCAKLGVAPDLVTTQALDWLGRMFADMAATYGVRVHPRAVERSSLSFILPKAGKRAILRARDDRFAHPFPQLNLDGCEALHLDGHMPDAAIHYAKACRERGVLTSLDGGGLRANTQELLGFVDVAVVAERLCEQMGLDERGMLAHLAARGCRVAGVTMGERGMLWRDEDGAVRLQPALPVPGGRIIDTSGAGDVFHGAYVWSYLARRGLRWADHFAFARGAAAHAIQILGNEAKLPSVADVERAIATYPAPAAGALLTT